MFMRLAAAAAGLDPSAVTSRVPSVSPLCVRRSKALGTVRGTPLPPLMQSLAEGFRSGLLPHHDGVPAASAV